MLRGLALGLVPERDRGNTPRRCREPASRASRNDVADRGEALDNGTTGAGSSPEAAGRVRSRDTASRASSPEDLRLRPEPCSHAGEPRDRRGRQRARARARPGGSVDRGRRLRRRARLLLRARRPERRRGADPTRPGSVGFGSAVPPADGVRGDDAGDRELRARARPTLPVPRRREAHRAPARVRGRERVLRPRDSVAALRLFHGRLHRSRTQPSRPDRLYLPLTRHRRTRDRACRGGSPA